MAATSRKTFLSQVLLILFMLPVLGYTAWCSYVIYNLSAERTELKSDYSEVNNIQYGLLSVNRWRDNITEIVSTQIEGFSLSNEQEKELKIEINQTLNALITQADAMINDKPQKLKGKIRKLAFNTFVDLEEVRKRVPEFSQTIINQIKKPANKEKLKLIATAKIDEFANQTVDSLAIVSYDSLLKKYNTDSVPVFNQTIARRSDSLHVQSYEFMFRMLAMLALLLLVWFLIRNNTSLKIPMFIISVLFAFILLFTGLVNPMIEIDARIQHINFMLVGQQIEFNDQVLFYQSKSIIDVVKILIETGKADSVFVGGLLLIFSIIFPIAKLLSTELYLMGSDKIKNSRIIKFFAFKSGKWSMADVAVVAIFMAYVGFEGILDKEIGYINEDMNNQYVKSITTHKTALQPGFIIFISFVVFGLLLSEILKRITPKTKTE